MARPKKITKEQFFQVVTHNMTSVTNVELLCEDFYKILNIKEIGDECEMCPYSYECNEHIQASKHLYTDSYKCVNDFIINLAYQENKKRLDLWKDL